MPVRFSKWQGAGNDFVLVDRGPGTQEGPDLASWCSLAPALCDRRFGVGADGILLLESAQDADFELIVINADGSVAEMCGNGLRCAARHRAASAGVPTSVRVRTGAGVLVATVRPDGRVRVDMGAPRPSAAELAGASSQQALCEPLAGTGLEVACVSMGNPHAVAFVADLDRLDFAALGPAVSSHERFPAGTNAGFAQVLGRHEIRLAVWERGSGPTLACGTGACAAAVAGILTDRLESPVAVHLPGGDLEIEWSAGGPVHMTGPAEPVFDGELDLSAFAACKSPS